MKADWKKVKLGEVCLKIGSGATPNGGSRVYIDSGVSFIRSQNVYNLNFEYNGLTYITDGAAKKLRGVTIEKDDILLNITGDSVARTCIVPTNVLPARVNQHVSIIRLKKNTIIPKFLNYYLASPYMQSIMLGLAVGKGASRNAITKTIIENFEVPCPPLEIQQKIALILSAYDDLIENNRKQIKLLEEAAQRLYKEWFVDLRFPGYENVAIVDGVPDGWITKTIGEICVKLNSGGTPNRKKTDYWDSKDIKWYKTKELQDCWLFDSEEYISEKGLNNSSAKVFPKNTILMAIYASPTLGRLGVLTDEATCNQAALCMIADNESTSYQWLYLKLYELRDFFNSVARGAGQQNISADVVKNKQIILPNKNIMEKFTITIDPYFEKIKSLQQQIQLLQQARDKLLPRLMSGEMEV